MRARQIKPGFFKNETLAECTPHARLLFVGLWQLADREGRLEDRPTRIKAELFPYESIDTEVLLHELASRTNGAGKPELILRYSTEQGKFIQVVNFAKHQQPHYKEVPSSIQPPADWEDTEYLGGGVPESLRIAVIERDGRRCLSCRSTRDLTVDHVVPRSRGGSNDESNLQTLCRKCNSAKNNRVSARSQPNVGARSGRRRRKKVAPFPLTASSLIPSSLIPSSLTPDSPLPEPGASTGIALFQTFYDLYPRHEARATAEKAWSKILQAERLECLERTPAWIKAKEGTEKQFLPLPATYLNGKRWRDVVSAPSEKVHADDQVTVGRGGMIMPSEDDLVTGKKTPKEER